VASSGVNGFRAVKIEEVDCAADRHAIGVFIVCAIRLYRDGLADAIQAKVPAYEKSPIEASVLLISGCQDNQTSADGAKNGLFTQTLLEVWDEGKFRGSYRSFSKRIVKEMPPWQTPNFFTAGKPSRTFEHQQPFTI
jgi:hypothetical protein